VIAARALVIVVGDELDALAVRLSNVLLAEVGEKQRKAPRYLRYFDEAPSRLRRPVLGDQLKKMREWVPSLSDPQCSQPVRECGQRLAALVEESILKQRAGLSKLDALLAKLVEEEQEEARRRLPSRTPVAPIPDTPGELMRGRPNPRA
jgi:hypothetical protein